MGQLEDWYLRRAETRVPTSENEEILLLRTKLEVRTMIMRLYQTIAAGLFTGIITGGMLRLVLK
jgi:hypothetical protein